LKDMAKDYDQMLQDHINGIIQAARNTVLNLDGRFFARFPDRRHRVRLAAEIEGDHLRLINGTNPEDGERLFTVTKFDPQDGLSRRYIMLPKNSETDLDDAAAQRIWERAERSRNGIYGGKP
jgi:hypothetical protein